MRILVSNDDGIHNPALHALVRALLPLGEVIVSAPDRNRSGVGAALTLHDPVRARQVSFPVGGVKAFAVEGTPGDAVIMGMRLHAGGRVDAVVTGINPGNNIGVDLLVSGTVGGALHAYLNGLPAMAVSTSVIEDASASLVADVARETTAALPEQAKGRPMLVNLNFPDLRGKRVEGVMRTTVALRVVEDHVERQTPAGGENFWILRRAAIHAHPVPEPGTDIRAVRDGYISITGLTWNLGHMDAAGGTPHGPEPDLTGIVSAATGAWMRAR